MEGAGCLREPSQRDEGAPVRKRALRFSLSWPGACPGLRSGVTWPLRLEACSPSHRDHRVTPDHVRGRPPVMTPERAHSRPLSHPGEGRRLMPWRSDPEILTNLKIILTTRTL